MKLLYICTHNRCRSILSEAISQQRGKSLLEARSAGSDPAGEVHPLSIRYLRAAGYDTAGLCSESWNDYEHWAPDAVITVCDRAAGESCPLYFSHTIKLHWGLSDPSSIAGSTEDIEAAFISCIDIIEQRVDALTQIAQAPRNQWPQRLAALATEHNGL